MECKDNATIKKLDTILEENEEVSEDVKKAGCVCLNPDEGTLGHHDNRSPLY